MSKDSLGDRMKKYEDSFRFSIPARLPVIIRVDGKAFHSYTRGLTRPFCTDLIEVMNETAIALCKTIQGCKLAYVQSDEISLLLTNYDDLDTQSWFDNNLQKMVSVASSVASSTFTSNSWKMWTHTYEEPKLEDLKPANFDGRAFLLPKEEVTNYFIWRQQDCTRNSVQMVARSMYSHKELHKKSNSDLQDMIMAKGTNWNDLPAWQKRGRCIIKNDYLNDEGILRKPWVVDDNIPVFTKSRGYIDDLVEERDAVE